MSHLVHHICCTLVNARKIVARRRHFTTRTQRKHQSAGLYRLWACVDRGGRLVMYHVVLTRAHDLTIWSTWLCTTPPRWVASQWLSASRGMNVPTYQMLKPNDAMHSRWRLTSSSHFFADSPCSSTLWPNRRKQSSRAALVSGHAQQLGVSGQGTYGLIPLGLSSVTRCGAVLVLCEDMVEAHGHVVERGGALGRRGRGSVARQSSPHVEGDIRALA